MTLLRRIRTLSRVRPVPEPDLPEVAQSVAIILDGNGRWAQRRSLPVAAGHRAGARTVRADSRGLSRPLPRAELLLSTASLIHRSSFSSRSGSPDSGSKKRAARAPYG